MLNISSDTFSELIEKGIAPNEFRARIEAARSGIVENITSSKRLLQYKLRYGFIMIMKYLLLLLTLLSVKQY
jgi:hypothetical protein